MIMRSPVRDTILHLRPRSWPIVFAHFSGGAIIALAHHPEPDWREVLQVLVCGIVWTVLLNGGTLALNSAFDKDENGSDIGYLDNAPPPPRGLSKTAMNLMVVGLMIALALPWGFLWTYTLCMVLSLLYSVPPLRLKSVPGADLAINMAGYGALNFMAGAAAPGELFVHDNLGPAIALLALNFAFLFGAFYPMTQIYQMADDAAKGDRTIAVRLGASNVLALSIAAIVMSGIFQVIAAWIMKMNLWGVTALMVGSGAWIIFTIDWLRRSEGYPSQRGMYRALKLWAVSDIIVIIAFAYGTR